MKRIALGTAQFGMDYGLVNKHGQVNIEEVGSILEFAQSENINTLDTAISYGECENILGNFHLSDWNIITKLPEVPDGKIHIEEWIRSNVLKSLSRLNVCKVDAILLHRPEQLLSQNGDTIYAALQAAKSDNLTRKIGISVIDFSILDKIVSRYQIDIIQAPFNLMDRRLIQCDRLSRLHENGVEVHVRSVFLQGLLLVDSVNRPLKFNMWSELWSKWDDWLYQSGLTPLQSCINYVFGFSKIDKIVVGVDSLSQFKEILLISKQDSKYIPDYLECNDQDLINPFNWKYL